VTPKRNIHSLFVAERIEKTAGGSRICVEKSESTQENVPIEFNNINKTLK
jgi:hypothetical protein